MGDPLADGEFVEFMLSRNFFLAAHGFGKAAAMAHFLEFFIPTHRSLPSCSTCLSCTSKGDVTKSCNRRGTFNTITVYLGTAGYFHGNGSVQA